MEVSSQIPLRNIYILQTETSLSPKRQQKGEASSISKAMLITSL